MSRNIRQKVQKKVYAINQIKQNSEGSVVVELRDKDVRENNSENLKKILEKQNKLQKNLEHIKNNSEDSAQVSEAKERMKKNDNARRIIKGLIKNNENFKNAQNEDEKKTAVISTIENYFSQISMMYSQSTNSQVFDIKKFLLSQINMNMIEPLITDKYCMLWCCKKAFTEFVKIYDLEIKILQEEEINKKRYFAKFECMKKTSSVAFTFFKKERFSPIEVRIDNKKQKFTEFHSGIMLEEDYTLIRCPSKFNDRKFNDNSFVECNHKNCNYPHLTITSKILHIVARCKGCNSDCCISCCSCGEFWKKINMITTLIELTPENELIKNYIFVYFQLGLDNPKLLDLPNSEKIIESTKEKFLYCYNIPGECVMGNVEEVNYMNLDVSLDCNFGLEEKLLIPSDPNDRKVLSYTTIPELNILEDCFVIIKIYKNDNSSHSYIYFVDSITYYQKTFILRFKESGNRFLSISNFKKIEIGFYKFISSIECELIEILEYTPSLSLNGFLNKDNGIYNFICWLDSKKIPDYAIINSLIVRVQEANSYNILHFLKNGIGDSINMFLTEVRKNLSMAISLNFGESPNKKIKTAEEFFDLVCSFLI